MISQVLQCLIGTCFNMSHRQRNNSPNTQAKEPLIVDDLSSEESSDNTLNVTEEEKRGTVPGSTVATAMALAGARAQGNPTVERGPPHKRKRPKVKVITVTEATQTNSSEKSPE